MAIGGVTSNASRACVVFDPFPPILRCSEIGILASHRSSEVGGEIRDVDCLLGYRGSIAVLVSPFGSPHLHRRRCRFSDRAATATAEKAIRRFRFCIAIYVGEIHPYYLPTMEIIGFRLQMRKFKADRRERDDPEHPDGNVIDVSRAIRV